MAYRLPAGVQLIFAQLQLRGQECYVLGEPLCRSLLGLPVPRWNLLTTADPEALAALYPRAVPEGGRLTMEVLGTRCALSSSGTLPGAGTRRLVAETAAREAFTVFAVAHDGSRLYRTAAAEEDIAARRLRFSPVAMPPSGADVLRFFRISSDLGLVPDSVSFDAAVAAAPTLANVPSSVIRGEMQRILLGRTPARIAPLTRAGGLVFAGVGRGDISALNGVHPSLLCRWWALLRLSGGGAYAMCAALGYPSAFRRDLLWMNGRFDAPRPKTTKDLAAVLAGGMPCPFSDWNDAFEAVRPGSGYSALLYARLEEEGGVGQFEALPITPGMLTMAGIEQAEERQALYEALRRTAPTVPAMNRTEALLQAARYLHTLRRRG